MSRHPKGPRLYLRAARLHPRTRKPVAAVWVIRDGAHEQSTGCGAGGLAEAELALTEYLAAKHAAPVEGQDPADEEKRRSDPARVLVAEVLAYYADGKGQLVADPGSLKYRLAALLDFFQGDTLAQVKRSRCQKYVAHRMTQPIKAFKKSAPRMVTAQGARRELEDLSSAIGYWDDEHHLARRPKVWLPEKPESPRDAMTRSQCAALLWGAMGWRKGKDGKWKRLKKSARANRDHLRRFIVIGIYTGTRPGVIPKLLTHVSAVQAYTDLADGMIYRRGKAEKDHKTKRRPMVRCPDRLLAHMRRWARLDAALNAKRKKEDLPPIISVLHHGGRPITGRIRRAFASCVADAGLPAEITPHWLRHTCATLLMEQKGVDVWEAAAFTGMTVQTLEKCYGHHRPDHQAAARKAAGGKRA